jgi:2,5-dihydroxypyridine 5,6-dioxygenase
MNFMIDLYEFEVGKAARIMCDSLALKIGESVVITADTESDSRVVKTMAQAVHNAGAKPMVVLLATPLGVGKGADSMLPLEPLTACLKKADVWVEFNNQFLLYSTPYERVMEANKDIRYLGMIGMNVDMMIRTIGRVNLEPLRAFMLKVRDLTFEARKMRVTTPAGTDVSFENTKNHTTISCDTGRADVPGVHFLSGQIGWAPLLETVNGTIVFDGSITPPIGKLTQPVTLHVTSGRVIKIEGGWEAEQFEKWLRSFDDDNMFRLAHICYGFNPGAKLTGNVLEDERVWGCTEWGMGYQSAVDVPPDGIMAKSHTDGICLNSSVWLDNTQFLDRGKVVHPAVKALAAAAKNEQE